MYSYVEYHFGVRHFLGAENTAEKQESSSCLPGLGGRIVNALMQQMAHLFLS